MDKTIPKSKKYPVLEENATLVIQPFGGFVSSYSIKGDSLNPTGAEILELCDGKHTLKDICEILAEKHEDTFTRVFSLVSTFLLETERKGYIKFCDAHGERCGIITGSKEYWVPSDISLDITLKCNLRCKHCYAEASALREDPLSMKDYLRILKDVRDAGVLKVVFTGGEPLVQPDFFKLLRFCAERFIIVDIATNGYGMNEDIAKEIASLSGQSRALITARISIDGKPETHNYIRGKKDSWEKAVNAIKLLSNNGLLTNVSMTINPLNIDDIEYVIKIAKQSGAIRFSVGMTIAIGRAKNENFEITKEQKDFVTSKLSDLSSKYASSTFIVRPWMKASDIELISEKGPIDCGAGYRILAIDAYGNLKPCITLPYYFGNVIENGFKRLLMSPLPGFFFNLRWPTPEMCGNCENFYMCRECHAAAFSKCKMVSKCKWREQWKNLPEGHDNPFFHLNE